MIIGKENVDISYAVNDALLIFIKKFYQRFSRATHIIATKIVKSLNENFTES